MKFVIRALAVFCLLMTGTAASTAAQGLAASQIAKQLEKDFGLQTVYSADMVIQVNQTNVISRVFRNGDKYRTEMNHFMFNKQMITLQINEGNKNLFYHLFPDLKKYTVDEIKEEVLAAAPQIEELGTETYEGVVCIKRRITDVRENYRNEMTTLFSPEQKNMPVRTTMNVIQSYEPSSPDHADQNVILYKNYDFSTPDNSLFTIPSDYVKAASMQEIMKECRPSLDSHAKTTPPAQ